MTTVSTSLIGAPSAISRLWDSFNWDRAKKIVRRLQMRIAKAIQQGRFGKVKALQRLLTHSFSAKMLAVKRVCENKGAKTPGIDGVVWTTSKQKQEAVFAIRQHGYHAQPLRRLYIPKKNKAQRPLGIPILGDRAQQSLHLMTLEPVSEIRADPNSYGFRPFRSTADAIEQCFILLARKNSAQYILEGDIRSCFDTISHSWLRQNIPLNPRILKQWLKSGYLENHQFHHTHQGVPQGGIISPTLTVMTLSGLEAAVKTATHQADKVHVVVYADDFIITAASKEILEQKVKPVVEKFLRERGLELSEEKTQITHISQGFDFLGFNVRKYNGKLLIKPSKKNVHLFLEKLRKLIQSSHSRNTEELIRILNPKIRGWAMYYRHSVASKTFSFVDSSIFWMIWNWIRRRHPQKSVQWCRQNYFRQHKHRQWIFYSETGKQGSQYLDLARATDVKIKRHVKIKALAQPYDPNFQEYFEQRKRLKRIRKVPETTEIALPIF